VDLDCEVKIEPEDRKAASFEKKRSRRIILVAGTFIILLAILAFAFRSQILTGIADFLIIDDRLQPADAIFLLNSEFDTRPFQAAELYKLGMAPVVVIARSEDTPVVELGLVPNDTDISIGVMEKLGVPAGKIIVLPFAGGVTSTFDEAAAFRQYTKANRIQRIILVTSAFHTRRARWIFEKTLEELPVTLEMAAVSYEGFDQTDWWKSEGGLVTLNNEYIKLFYYFFKYL
jgi:uncharacterized SAM-binding protein YcdF (DUF218 family)